MDTVGWQFFCSTLIMAVSLDTNAPWRMIGSKTTKKIDRWVGTVGLRRPKRGLTRTRGALLGMSETSKMQRREMLLEWIRIFEDQNQVTEWKKNRQAKESEWEGSCCYMSISVASEVFRDDNPMENRSGQVVFLLVVFRGKLLVIVDYQINSRAAAYVRDILTGVIIEIGLFYGNCLEECKNPEDIVCFAFPDESQGFLTKILKDSPDLSHLMHLAVFPTGRNPFAWSLMLGSFVAHSIFPFPSHVFATFQLVLGVSSLRNVAAVLLVLSWS